MPVDFVNRNVDGEADEEKLLLLLQPDQVHLHLPLRAPVLHQKTFAAVVARRRILRLLGANGRADAPEGFVELVQQSQRYDAAVLRSVRKKPSEREKKKGRDPFSSKAEPKHISDSTELLRPQCDSLVGLSQVLTFLLYP